MKVLCFTLRGMLIICGLALMSGCAGFGDVRSIADRRLAQEGMFQASAVYSRQTTDGLEIISYGRSGGEQERMLRPDELEGIAVVASEWGTLTLLADPEELPMVRQGMWTEKEDDFQELLDLTEKVMLQTVSPLPRLSEHGVNVRVLLTTYDSGRAIESRHFVDDSPIALSLISPVVVPDGEKSFANPNIAMMASRVASVLLRAEHEFSGRRYGTVNQWAADSLFQRCTQSRFAMATELSATLGYKDEQFESWPGFPGLLEGEWAPRVGDFPVRNPQQRGQYVAAAWLFHATDRKASLDLADVDDVAPLLELCDRLGTDMPDFIRGETGLN